MRRRMMKLLCLFLSTTMLGAACMGCGKQEKKVVEAMEIEEVPTFSFPILGGDDVMPVA